MNARRRLSDDELAQLLAAQPTPEPPADLLDRLLADLPARPAEVPQPVNDRVERSPWWRRYAPLAATLAVAVGGGIVALRVLERPAPQPSSDSEIVPARAMRPVEVPARDGQAEAAQPLPSSPAAPAPDPGAVEPQAKPEPKLERVAPATFEDAAGADREVADPLQVSESLTVIAPAPQVDSTSSVSGLSMTAPSGRENESRRVDDSHSADRAASQPAPAAPKPQASASTAAGGVGQSEGRRYRLESEPEPPRRVARREEAEGRDGREGAIGDRLRAAEESARAKKVPMPGATPPVADQRQEHELKALGYVGSGTATTGGTAEPNDQVYGAVFVETAGVNPFVATEDDALSTFALEVDTGSWSMARAWLERGQLPLRESVRVEEALNSYDYGDPSPRSADFALAIDGAPSPWPGGQRRQLVRIGLTARQLERGERKPVVLIALVDTSGSMAQDGRLELVKHALSVLLERLRPGDRVGVVTYSDDAELVLTPTGDLEQARRAISRLYPRGSTNAEAGLRSAYQVAESWLAEGRDVRVVLCSDGVANVGATGPDSILESLRRWKDRGIELTAVGVGLGNYNDVLLEQLADRADGRYAYVDDRAEAEKVFGEALDGTLSTLAHEARIQVAFDPRQVDRWRLIGYENRAMPDSAFRDDSRDGGEIGFGHRVTALYELVTAKESSARRPLGEVRLRWRPQGQRDFVEVAEPIRSSDLAPSFARATPALRLAASVAGLAEVLRGSPWVAGLELLEVERWIDGLPRQLRDREDVRRLAELVTAADRLGARSVEGDDSRGADDLEDGDGRPVPRSRAPIERR